MSIMKPYQQHETLTSSAIEPTVLEFELSNMGSRMTLQETLKEFSPQQQMEGKEDQTQCTEADSDNSSQSGSHFSYLKSVEGSTKRIETPNAFPRSLSFSTLKTQNASYNYIITGIGARKVLSAPDLNIICQQSEKSVDSTASRRKVKFHEVELRFYDQTIGDHPNTSYGPPISLNWAYQEAEPIPIDEYELHRGQRRTMKQMVLSYYARKNVLMWCYGHTETELKKATKASKRIAIQRGVTSCLLPVSKLEILVTSAGRKAKRAMKMGKRSNSTI